MESNISKNLSKSSQLIFGLLFFGIFIAVGIGIFISDDPAVYVGLMIGFAGPFGILGFSLLFSNSRKRKAGLLSPLTLRLCGAFCILMGLFVMLEGGAEGLSHGSIAFFGAIILFALAKKRAVQRNRSKYLSKK